MRDLARDLESVLYTNALRATRHSQLFDVMVGHIDQDAQERASESEAVAERERDLAAQARAIEAERAEHLRRMEEKERDVARMKAAWAADRKALDRCVLPPSRRHCRSLSPAVSSRRWAATLDLQLPPVGEAGCASRRPWAVGELRRRPLLTPRPPPATPPFRSHDEAVGQKDPDSGGAESAVSARQDPAAAADSTVGEFARSAIDLWSSGPTAHARLAQLGAFAFLGAAGRGDLAPSAQESVALALSLFSRARPSLRHLLAHGAGTVRALRAMTEAGERPSLLLACADTAANLVALCGEGGRALMRDPRALAALLRVGTRPADPPPAGTAGAAASAWRALCNFAHTSAAAAPWLVRSGALLCARLAIERAGGARDLQRCGLPLDMSDIVPFRVREAFSLGADGGEAKLLGGAGVEEAPTRPPPSRSAPARRPMEADTGLPLTQAQKEELRAATRRVAACPTARATATVGEAMEEEETAEENQHQHQQHQHGDMDVGRVVTHVTREPVLAAARRCLVQTMESLEAAARGAGIEPGDSGETAAVSGTSSAPGWCVVFAAQALANACLSGPVRSALVRARAPEEVAHSAGAIACCAAARHQAGSPHALPGASLLLPSLLDAMAAMAAMGRDAQAQLQGAGAMLAATEALRAPWDDAAHRCLRAQQAARGGGAAESGAPGGMRLLASLSAGPPGSTPPWLEAGAERLRCMRSPAVCALRLIANLVRDNYGAVTCLMRCDGVAKLCEALLRLPLPSAAPAPASAGDGDRRSALPGATAAVDAVELFLRAQFAARAISQVCALSPDARRAVVGKGCLPALYAVCHAAEQADLADLVRRGLSEMGGGVNGVSDAARPSPRGKLPPLPARPRSSQRPASRGRGRGGEGAPGGEEGAEPTGDEEAGEGEKAEEEGNREPVSAEPEGRSLRDAQGWELALFASAVIGATTEAARAVGVLAQEPALTVAALDSGDGGAVDAGEALGALEAAERTVRRGSADALRSVTQAGEMQWLRTAIERLRYWERPRTATYRAFGRSGRTGFGVRGEGGLGSWSDGQGAPDPWEEADESGALIQGPDPLARASLSDPRMGRIRGTDLPNVAAPLGGGEKHGGGNGPGAGTDAAVPPLSTADPQELAAHQQRQAAKLFRFHQGEVRGPWFMPQAHAFLEGLPLPVARPG